MHKRVGVEPEDGAAVERLVRYIMRPPIASERLEWDGAGAVGYRLLAGHDTRLLPSDVLERLAGEETASGAGDPGGATSRAGIGSVGVRPEGG